jgi:hypothetical protein
MNDTGFTIVNFNEPEFHRLLHLSETEYSGREIADPGYLDWEYVKNPDGRALITVAMRGNEVASQYIVIPRKYSIGGEVVTGSLSVNTLTHPASRGKGQFPLLAEETFRRCAEKNIRFTIGFPNAISSPVIERKKIFDLVGTLPLLIKPLRVLSPAWKYLSGNRDKTGSEIELEIPAGVIREGVSLLNLSGDAGAYADFLDTVNRARENITYRSIDFLRWRYAQIPLRKYRILKLTYKEKIVGLAVLRARYVYGMRCGILVDLLTARGDYPFEYLMKAISSVAKANKLDLVFTTVPLHAPEYRMVRRSGFYPLPARLQPQKLAMIARRHGSDCPKQVSDFSKWFITFGDYDIF